MKLMKILVIIASSLTLIWVGFLGIRIQVGVELC